MGFLFEKHSISDNVLLETDKIVNIIKNNLSNTNILSDFRGNYFEGSINNYNLFNIPYSITYKCYISYTNVKFIKKLVSTTYINDGVMELNLYMYMPKYFESSIIHEILHVYQYSKNKHIYLNNNYNKKLYNAFQYIKKNSDNYSDIENVFANALYASFPFEQDAMTHGFYGTLSKCNIYEIQVVYDETDEWKYLLDIEKSIENINQFNPELFNNVISKNAFLSRLKNSQKRFKQKLNNAKKRIFEKKDEELFENEILGFPNIPHN